MPNPEPTIPGPLLAPKKPDAALPPKSCDCHAHIFGPATAYPYAADRDYTPHDAPRETYADLLHHLGFERAVLVQPSAYGTDNSLMIDALEAQAKGDGLGIEWRAVVVIEDTISDAELERLDTLGVRGARLNLVNSHVGIGFDSVERLAGRLAALGWHLQFFIDISEVEGVCEFMRRLPVTSVIDHFGHFPASLGPRFPAFQDLLGLLRDAIGYVKISGPNRFSSHATAPFDDACEMARSLFCAAPDRVLFGTDWPHVRLKTPIPDDGVLLDELYRWTDTDAALIRRILVDNPARLYRF